MRWAIDRGFAIDQECGGARHRSFELRLDTAESAGQAAEVAEEITQLLLEDIPTDELMTLSADALAQAGQQSAMTTGLPEIY